MPATAATKYAPECSPILMVTLEQDLDQMRTCGFEPAEVECGLEVFALLLDWYIYNQNLDASTELEETQRAREEESMRVGVLRHCTLTYAGMLVRCFADVPDGRFWPSRTAGDHAIPQAYAAVA